MNRATLACRCTLIAWLCACGATEKGVPPGGSTDPLAGTGGSAGGAQVANDRAANAPAASDRGGSQVMDGMGAVGRASVPALENGRYVFRADELELEVNPAVGGRITRFSLGGTNILTGPEVVAQGDGALP